MSKQTTSTKGRMESMLNRITNCWEDGEEGGINFDKMVRKISQRRNRFNWALKDE